jgi:hypothetical protein
LADKLLMSGLRTERSSNDLDDQPEICNTVISDGFYHCHASAAGGSGYVDIERYGIRVIISW